MPNPLTFVGSDTGLEGAFASLTFDPAASLVLAVHLATMGPMDAATYAILAAANVKAPTILRDWASLPAG